MKLLSPSWRSRRGRLQQPTFLSGPTISLGEDRGRSRLSSSSRSREGHPFETRGCPKLFSTNFQSVLYNAGGLEYISLIPNHNLTGG